MHGNPLLLVIVIPILLLVTFRGDLWQGKLPCSVFALQPLEHLLSVLPCGAVIGCVAFVVLGSQLSSGSQQQVCAFRTFTHMQRRVSIVIRNFCICTFFKEELCNLSIAIATGSSSADPLCQHSCHGGTLGCAILTMECTQYHPLHLRTHHYQETASPHPNGHRPQPSIYFRPCCPGIDGRKVVRRTFESVQPVSFLLNNLGRDAGQRIARKLHSYSFLRSNT